MRAYRSVLVAATTGLFLMLAACAPGADDVVDDADTDVDLREVLPEAPATTAGGGLPPTGPPEIDPQASATPDGLTTGPTPAL